MSEQKYHALALFSGGLDSILAIKLIEKQGLKVKCLHFVSPFFGSVEKIPYWQETYNIEIDPIDIGEAYSTMLDEKPVYGFGSTLNPCVDCKILMMRTAKSLLEHYGAEFIISGEVLGQRPMSQRRDTLNIIHRDADIKDILLRPLCAKHMTPTSAELSGLVNRELLENFSGRGRGPQIELAKKLGITDIPTPAGGCKLTEKDTSARYWNVLTKHNASSANFDLANTGRQFWHDQENIWLVIGRNQADNAKLEQLAQEGDILFRVDGFPSPLGLMRPMLQNVSKFILEEASSLLASYSPKAVTFSQSGQAPNEFGEVENALEISVIIKEIIKSDNKNESHINNESQEILFKENNIKCTPKRTISFKEPDWDDAKLALKPYKTKH